MKRNLTRLKDQILLLQSSRALNFENISKLDTVLSDYKKLKIAFENAVDEMLIFADENDTNFEQWETELMKEVTELLISFSPVKVTGEVSEQIFSRFIAFFIISKLDNTSARDFENSITIIKSHPTYEELRKYLQIRSFVAGDCNLELKLKQISSYSKPAKTPSFEKKFTFSEAEIKAKTNITYTTGETIDELLTSLKALASLGKFHPDEKKQFIRDILILGLIDPSYIEHLLREPKLTLIKAATFLRAKELSEKQTKVIVGNSALSDKKADDSAKVDANKKSADKDKRKKKSTHAVNGDDNSSKLSSDSTTLYLDSLQLASVSDDAEKRDMFDKFNDVFERKKNKLPCLYQMKLTDNVTLTVEPVRNIPYALRDKMKAHLDDIVANSGMEKVEEPTD
ncbi:hypothetical protein PGB90_003975 [Kerria lacca]